MLDPTDEVRPDIQSSEAPIEIRSDSEFSGITFILFIIFLCVEFVVILIH